MMKNAALVIVLSCLFTDAYAQNGGTSCETATNFISGLSYTSDTTAAPNWMGSFGPLVSPANDVVYTFVAPASPDGDFIVTPAASNYQFALYLIASCTSGAEPAPIGATATIASPITGSNLSTPLVPGHRYYVAATGAASAGAVANGTITFSTPIPVELQTFDVE
jgi:hypothetical protein